MMAINVKKIISVKKQICDDDGLFVGVTEIVPSATLYYSVTVSITLEPSQVSAKTALWKI